MPSSNATPRIELLTLGAEPGGWTDAGFQVTDDAMLVGQVGMRFSDGEGIIGWRLSGVARDEIDGLPVTASSAADPSADESHPNGVTHIDHLVVFTPDLERTTVALEDAGVNRRRVREAEAQGVAIRQGFFRLGEVILEVVEHEKVEPGPARFWGITFAVEDLDASASLLGDRLGEVRDAIQPGRQIATFRREAGLGLPVALISADPATSSFSSSP